MNDAIKQIYDKMLADEQAAKAKPSQADLIGRMSTEPQIYPDSPILRPVEPSIVEKRLSEIERKLDLIIGHLNIPR